MLYDLGGRGLYLECAGEGSPTVVFEAGAGPVISRSRACSPERLAQVRPGLRPGLGAALEDLWQELQADLAGLSRDSFHLIAPESGHYVHHDQPALVVEAIRRVVLAARLGGTHLQNWARGQEFGS